MTSSPLPQVGVGAVVVHEGQLLLVRRLRAPGAGRWSVPGGRVEAGERLAAAAVRELAEETGLDGVCGPLVGITEHIGADAHLVILDFRVSAVDPSAALVAGDDAADVAWAPLQEVSGWHLVEGLAAFLREHGIID